MSQVQGSTLMAPPSEPAAGHHPGGEVPADPPRGGNGPLRLLGLAAVGAVGGLVAWDLRRRGLPAAADLGEFAPHLLLVVPLLAGLGMLLGRRPPTWGGLLLGGGTWAVLGAVWSGRWFAGAGGRLLGGDTDAGEFAEGLTWVPYAALVMLGVVVLVTVLALRGHRAREACHTRGHQFLSLGAAFAALLGPLWVLALVPAMGLGLRRPHRAAAVTWAGWVAQGVMVLALAANGEIPSSGLPALVLHPSAPTTLLLSLPLFAVAAFAGALAALPSGTCIRQEPLEAFTSSIAWTAPNEAGVPE